jgi:hypothetical protein
MQPSSNVCRSALHFDSLAAAGSIGSDAQHCLGAGQRPASTDVSPKLCGRRPGLPERREAARRDGSRVEDDGRSSVSERRKSWFSGWFGNNGNRLVRCSFGGFLPVLGFPHVRLVLYRWTDGGLVPSPSEGYARPVRTSRLWQLLPGRTALCFVGDDSRVPSFRAPVLPLSPHSVRLPP